MGIRLLNESFIRERSGELQIPFENLLAASILEEIVQRIYESDYAANFWMKNSARLNMENYKRKVDLHLSFYIEDTEKLKYKKAEISKVFSALFRNLKKDAVHWNYNIWMDWGIIYVDMIATVSSVKVPVKIKLGHIEEENLLPYKKGIQLFTNNNRKIKVKCYPSEYLITEMFLEVLDKLELINNLSSYMEIYDILKKEALTGRKVWELVAEGCKQRGIEIKEERLALLLSYRTSSYMKKKWKAYLRHEKKKGPSWDDVIDMLERFFSVIWEHMCQNFIYLGDWMPELGRFID